MVHVTMIQNSAALDVFFSEIDFSRPEDGSEAIILTKRDSNQDTLVVRISFFTFDEYDASSLPAPSSPLPVNRPDPAECETH